VGCPAPGVPPRDITCQTRTLAAPGANAAAEPVTTGRPDSPLREVDVFLACMNRLFKETVAFSVLGQTTQPRGAIQVFAVTVSVGVKR